jgi:hypothetical protein
MQTNFYKKVHFLHLHSFLISRHLERGLKYIIGYFLELSFARQFSQTNKCQILYVLKQLHNVLILSLKQYPIPKLHNLHNALIS